MSPAELRDYRESPAEQARIVDLFSLMPEAGSTALDIGARDGYLAVRIAERFDRVTALDLVEPRIVHPGVQCVRGDVTNLDFEDDSFDLVLCAEVLEHVPPGKLEAAGAEIARVTRGVAVIGVPYRQDLRVGRTTCNACGKVNPPWGHVNRFDEERLASLFPGMTIVRRSYVGQTTLRTNAISAALMDLAGNPYGTWDQEEPCVHCGQLLGEPPPRTLARRLAARAAVVIGRAQEALSRPHANWMHVSLAKGSPADPSPRRGRRG